MSKQRTTVNRVLSLEFARGARAAADVASNYDSSSAHDHRLGDCILAKLNLRAAPPRRNRKKLESPDRAFVRGMSLALAEMHRRTGCSSDVQEIARGAGLSLKDMRDAGVSSYDLRRLRQAGVRRAREPRAR